MRRWQLTVGMAATAIGAAWLAPRLLPGDEPPEGVQIDTPPAHAVPGQLAYRDRDGDGFGDEVTRRLVHGPIPAGHVAVGGDCNDQRASLHPWAEEVPDDGVDQNCDGRDRTPAASQIPELDQPPPVVPLPPEPAVDWDRIEPACGRG
jgi:hypothetical protein